MPDKMSEPTVQFTPEFKRNLRTLAKKYRYSKTEQTDISATQIRRVVDEFQKE